MSKGTFSDIAVSFNECLFKGREKYEPAHDKPYNKTCVTRKDSDQPVHPPSMAMVLTDAQADLSLCWSHVLL